MGFIILFFVITQGFYIKPGSQIVTTFLIKITTVILL